MLTIARPDAEEALTNETFEALMWSLSRPGEIRTMPEPGFAAIARTLVDLECKVFVDDAALRPVIVATGAHLVDDITQADHVFLTDPDAEILSRVACGSALYPDDGATVVIAAAHEDGARLSLTGPGIKDETQIDLSVPANVWAMREASCTYPEGFDMFIVDGDRVVGIPRSTKVEIR